MKYFLFLLTLVLLAPELAFAALLEYQSPMVNIPGYVPGQPNGLETYVNLVYGISISVAALLAVIKIVIAGVKWMLSDVVTNKIDAKNDIQGALLGLIVIISAVLIITIINPSIVGA